MFQINDRIEDRDGNKADVLKISKDGKRIYVSMWSAPFGGQPKQLKLWDSAASWRLLRPAS